MRVFWEALCLAFVINILMPLSEILVSLSFMVHKIYVIYCCFGTSASLSSSSRVKSHDQRKWEREKNGKTDWVKEQRAKRPWQGAREPGRGSPSFPKGTCFLEKEFSSVQLLSRVWLFGTPWIAACQAPLSITNSWSSGDLPNEEKRARVLSGYSGAQRLVDKPPGTAGHLDTGLELWEKGKSVDQKAHHQCDRRQNLPLSFLHLTNSM